MREGCLGEYEGAVRNVPEHCSEPCLFGTFLLPAHLSECVAGVWEPAAASRLRSRLLNLLNAARAHREHVWVAGFDEHRLHAFGERATALAAFGSMPRPGGLPLGWVPAAPPDPLWAGEDCSVCMETFSSP